MSLEKLADTMQVHVEPNEDGKHFEWHESLEWWLDATFTREEMLELAMDIREMANANR